jgi:hypothetical protein
MSRIPRIIIPGIPHHIVQRGNRRQQVFFNDDDYLFYLKLLKKHGDEFGLSFGPRIIVGRARVLISKRHPTRSSNTVPYWMRFAIGNRS